MGSPKLLLPWGPPGSTVVEEVLAAWRGSRVERIVVVTHPDDGQLAEICRRAGAEVFAAPSPPPDMKASIRWGLEYLAEVARPADDDAWLAAPADLPLLTTATIDRVIEAYERRIATAARLGGAEGAGVIRALRPRHGDKFGHPVLWPWRGARLVAGLPEDRGLDALLEQTGFDEVPCEADAVESDLDTPDEYRRLRNRHDRNDV